MRPRIAIIGDRGIPARHSGFSTLVEEIATRLVRDHSADVTVYCRSHYYPERPREYKGVRCVYLPAPGGKSFESIVHSNLAILHAALRGFDLALVVDPGNGPFVLPLMLRRVPSIIHTDGLGWQRTKWNRWQRLYYKWAEGVSARLSTWLVTDSRRMGEYYQREYGAQSTYIPYGHVTGEPPGATGVESVGVTRGGYLLLVARMEPENNVDLIVREYRHSHSKRALLVVGGTPYESDYARRVMSMADERVRFLGPVWDSALLNALYRDCYLYVHGHEVGGTNPSLLRAMGARAACLPIDVPFHREVLGDENDYFEKAPGRLAALLEQLEGDPVRVEGLSALARRRATTHYRWDAVAAAYNGLFRAVIEARRAGGRFRPGVGFEPYQPEDFKRRDSGGPTGSTVT